MSEQEISIQDYKVFVFDLDDTLYLHNVDLLYREEYTRKVKEFLQLLKDSGKILCLATHNKSPYTYLHKMDIYDIFNEIIYETRNVHPSLNSIYDYTNKKYMIQEILDKTNSKHDEVIFFDDHMYNINEVKSIGVETVYVSPQTGIMIEKLMLSC